MSNLKPFTKRQLLEELLDRLGEARVVSPTPPVATFREMRSVLIVTGVRRRPTPNQLNELKSYTSTKSVRRVEDVTYDQLHRCLRIVTWNASHGQNFQDDLAWLVGKTTRDVARLQWTDSNGRGRRFGFLHKLKIEFSWVVQG